MSMFFSKTINYRELMNPLFVEKNKILKKMFAKIQ